MQEPPFADTISSLLAAKENLQEAFAESTSGQAPPDVAVEHLHAQAVALRESAAALWLMMQDWDADRGLTAVADRLGDDFSAWADHLERLRAGSRDSVTAGC
jgi:hypothetical protein